MIYTIGHSTYTTEDFLAVAEPLDLLMDIRSHPGSAKWPQYNKESMEQWLPASGIEYVWEPGLGGWRTDHRALASKFAKYDVDVEVYTKGKFPKQRIAARLDHGDAPMWYVAGMYDFQFFMILDEFRIAADRLIELGRERNVGICCCELLPWRCHRSMVADYLIYRGVDSTHLQPKPKLHSQMLGNRLERYHPDVLAKWADWR